MFSKKTKSTGHDASLDKMETAAREESLQELARTLDSAEAVEKFLADRKKTYENASTNTETQLKLAVHNQLDGVRTGLNKLDSALKEAQLIRERTIAIKDTLSTLAGLSGQLVDLREKCRHYNNLDATMNHMKQVALVPEYVNRARQAMEKGPSSWGCFLEAHQILQELEGMRNDIMLDIFQHDPESVNLKIVADFFHTDVESLNKEMKAQIRHLASSFMAAVLNQNSFLVTWLRIIDREERADKLWQDRFRGHGFMPPGRPKKWKEYFFESVREHVIPRVEESDVDQEGSKSRLVKHLEIIRLHCVDDLKMAKNICPPFFPPDYNVFYRYFSFYHDSIAQHVENVIEEGLKDYEVFQLLGFIHSYQSDKFMGQFGIDFSQAEITFPPTLVTAKKFDELCKRYVKENIDKFQQWKAKTLAGVKKDWCQSDKPRLDGSAMYYTELSVLLLSPIYEMIRENVLAYVGDLVKDRMVENFTREVTAFVPEYELALKNYRDGYYRDRRLCTSYMEYVIANVNDCDTIPQSYREMIDRLYTNNPNSRGKMEDELNRMSDAYKKLRELCVEYAIEVILVDLKPVFESFMTKDWYVGNEVTGSRITATLDDYRNDTINHMKLTYQFHFWNKIALKICVCYIVRLLKSKLPISGEMERNRLSELLNEEAISMTAYFTKRNVNKKYAEQFDALRSIATIISNVDKSMLLLDILQMQKLFPDLRKEHLQIILMLRGDTNSNEAKSILSEYISNKDNPSRKVGENVDNVSLFTEVANATIQ